MIPDKWLPDVKVTWRHLEGETNIFEQSGFKFRLTIMLIAILVGQFVVQFVIMNGVATFLMLVWIGFCSKRCLWAKKAVSSLFNFSLVSFPLRYLTENFLQLWVTLMIEINFLAGRYNGEYYSRKLISKQSVFTFIAFSGVFLILHGVGVGVLVVKALLTIKKGAEQPKAKSWLLTFVKGLNTKRRCYGILYFAHYLGFRFIVSLLILLSPYLPSFILWILIIIMQFISLVIHFFKIYEAWINYLLVMIREV